MRRGPTRTADRRVTACGLWVAGSFLVLAVASAFLPEDVRRGDWLPVHLALAGGATQAIAAALPFFVASLAAARPAPWQLRALVLALLGLGAVAVTVGVSGHSSALATTGGVGFVSGITLLAVATFLPLRRALGRRYPWIQAAYAIALADVAMGATLATVQVDGWAPVVADWGWLKPAHAWLNLLGFVSLVVAGTLLHLYPTVVGSRIMGGLRVRAMVAALAAGAPLVALGYVARIDAVGRIGGALELAGALALTSIAAGAWRTRGRWTGDLAWRRVAIGSLGAGIGWFVVAVAVAAGRVVLEGPVPEAWSLDLVGAPLAAGWVVQSIVGAWTHLLPAISGGSLDRHGAQRRILGTAATPRLIVLNGGVLLLSVGVAWPAPAPAVAGALLVAAGLLAAIVAFARASLMSGVA